MTFYARYQVEVLLDGLDLLRLEETERDGHAFSGPKHWHTFDILARKPISKRPPAPGYPAGLRASQTVRLVRTVRSLRAGRVVARASRSAMSPALSLSSRPCRARQRVTVA